AAGPPRGDDRTPTERGRLAPAGPAAGRPDAADDERDAPEQALGLPGDSRLLRRGRLPAVADVSPRSVAEGQYAGWLGSIWSTHAATPPPTCTASADPAPLTMASASADRTPVLQCSTICLSAGSCPSALPLRNSPLGISTEPGIWLISYSFC